MLFSKVESFLGEKKDNFKMSLLYRLINLARNWLHKNLSGETRIKKAEL